MDSSAGGGDLRLRRTALEPVGDPDTDPSSSSSSTPLTLLSWNVLADGLAQTGRWTHCPAAVLEWQTRAPALLAEVDAAAPDLLCLQECNHWANWWQDKLAARGYDGAFWAKPGSPAARAGAPPDGCAIAWRRDRFSLVGVPEGRPFDARCLGRVRSPPPVPGPRTAPIDSAATDEEVVPTPPAIITPSGEALALTPPRGVQGSLVVTLADCVSGRAVVLGCTHLKAKAGAEEEVVRGRQAAEAAARVVRAGERAAAAGSKKGGGGPTPFLILAGDFNAGPGTAAARAPGAVGLASVWDAPGGTPWGWSTFKWRTAGVGRGAEAAAAAPDGPPRPSRGLVDHIFYRGARLDGRWPPLAEEALPEGLPCVGYPSDHVAGLARWWV